MDKADHKRNSSFELLRIFSMLFIVCSHCSVHRDLPEVQSLLFFNNLLLDWCVLGNLGVDIFVLITGYFSSCSRNLSRKSRGVKLLTQVWFFSVLGFLIYLITGHHITLKIILETIFPTVFSAYWFFTAYFVLLLFMPYINIVLDKLTRKQMIIFIVIMMLLWSVIPTFTNQKMCGENLCLFVMLYSIGAYFRKYPDNNILTKKKYRYLLTILCFALMFLSSVVLRIVFNHHTTYFYSRSSILTVGSAIGLFSFAVYGRKFYSKWINNIAACTFGVYLFHDNPLMRELIWTEWLPKSKFLNSYLLIAVIFLSVIIVMTVSTAVEWLRRITVKKPFEHLMNNIITKIQTGIQSAIRSKRGKSGAEMQNKTDIS